MLATDTSEPTTAPAGPGIEAAIPIPADKFSIPSFKCSRAGLPSAPNLFNVEVIEGTIIDIIWNC